MPPINVLSQKLSETRLIPSLYTAQEVVTLLMVMSEKPIQSFVFSSLNILLFKFSHNVVPLAQFQMEVDDKFVGNAEKMT